MTYLYEFIYYLFIHPIVITKSTDTVINKDFGSSTQHSYPESMQTCSPVVSIEEVELMSSKLKAASQLVAPYVSCVFTARIDCL